MSNQSPATDNVTAYIEATAAYAAARVRYAQEFQLAFARSSNSFHATQVAIEKTKDEVTLALAAMKVAELRMERE